MIYGYALFLMFSVFVFWFFYMLFKIESKLPPEGWNERMSKTLREAAEIREYGKVLPKKTDTTSE